jgi:transposase
MQYRKIQYWIDWQAKKHGLLIDYVYTAYSSIKCPKCKIKNERNLLSLAKSKCGYENDRNILQ